MLSSRVVRDCTIHLPSVVPFTTSKRRGDLRKLSYSSTRLARESVNHDFFRSIPLVFRNLMGPDWSSPNNMDLLIPVLLIELNLKFLSCNKSEILSSIETDRMSDPSCRPSNLSARVSFYERIEHIVWKHEKKSNHVWWPNLILQHFIRYTTVACANI